MKILNLYPGIGGNRGNWDGEKHDITAVELNEEIANEYARLFPKDNIVLRDAHQYLLENYEKFDFIWASPPCPTHSTIRVAGTKNSQYDEKYPDWRLWQEILFLHRHFKGDFVVENVKPYYDKHVEWDEFFVEPQECSRHYFWSNFNIPQVKVPTQNINQGNCDQWQKWLGLDVKKNWETVERRKVLRNAVHPKIGEAILKSRNKKQVTLDSL